MIRLMVIAVDVAVRLIIHVHKRAIVDQFKRATRSFLNESIIKIEFFLRICLDVCTSTRGAARERKKKKENGWGGGTTINASHCVQCAHTHTHTRTRRAHYLWFYLQNADFSKQTTTNGRKPSSTVLFCCARSDPALHTHTDTNIYTR